MLRSFIWLDIVLITSAFSMISLSVGSVVLPTNNSMTCDEARLRCAYRTGCGMALQHYLTRCTSVLHGDIIECPESCEHALIALTSTDEGKDLMRCDCTHGDHLCMQSKQRVEVCRSSVTAAMNKTRISCRIATWICNADALCSTALHYYNENCRNMFLGRKCTPRCQNSIKILKRQEKADKLNTCICDGAEDYDCRAIHRHMDFLCYKKEHNVYHNEKKVTNETCRNNICGSSSNAVGMETASVINRMSLCLYTVLLLLNK